MSNSDLNAADTREPTKRGEVVWHSSEEGGGPDVGIHIALGGDASIWIGEISRRELEDSGIDALSLGGDGIWWITLHAGTDRLVLAKCVDWMEARDAAFQIAAALRQPEPASLAKAES